MPAKKIENTSRVPLSLPAAPSADMAGFDLPAGVPSTVTIPEGTGYVYFSTETNFRATYDGTDPIFGEVSPVLREVSSSTILRLYSTDGGYVCLVFYK